MYTRHSVEKKCLKAARVLYVACSRYRRVNQPKCNAGTKFAVSPTTAVRQDCFPNVNDFMWDDTCFIEFSYYIQSKWWLKAEIFIQAALFPEIVNFLRSSRHKAGKSKLTMCRKTLTYESVRVFKRTEIFLIFVLRRSWIYFETMRFYTLPPGAKWVEDKHRTRADFHSLHIFLSFIARKCRDQICACRASFARRKDCVMGESWKCSFSVPVIGFDKDENFRVYYAYMDYSANIVG